MNILEKETQKKVVTDFRVLANLIEALIPTQNVSTGFHS